MHQILSRVVQNILLYDDVKLSHIAFAHVGILLFMCHRELKIL